MASRSRLGRDPLDGVAQPATKKSTKPKAPAKGKTARGAKPTMPAKPASVPTPAEAAPVLEQAALAPQPMDTSVLLPEPPQAVIVAPAAPVEPFSRSEPLDEPVAAPMLEPRSRGLELPECAAAAPLPDAPAEPAREAESQPEEPSAPELPEAAAAAAPVEPFPRSEPIAAVAPEAMPTAPAAASVSETPPETAAAADTPPPDAAAVCAPCQACRASDVQGPHPTEVFLRGILEGLATAGGLSLDVVVDPETFDLPVEALFYCSHALQLLVSPLETPAGVWRRPGGKTDPPARVSVRLSKAGSERHSLRIYDNGHFFRRFLPEISLETEVLRPLLLFVMRRGGSICLKQGGACAEFEIIG